MLGPEKFYEYDVNIFTSLILALIVKATRELFACVGVQSADDGKLFYGIFMFYSRATTHNVNKHSKTQEVWWRFLKLHV